MTPAVMECLDKLIDWICQQKSAGNEVSIDSVYKKARSMNVPDQYVPIVVKEYLKYGKTPPEK